MKEIYIVRHGETDYNLRGIVQGRGIDSRLNGTGRRQSELLYRRYGSTAFDRIYTSSQRRSHETVHAFTRKEVPHLACPELDEIDWGIFEGVEHDPGKHKAYLDIIDQWKNGDLHVKITGGESAQDLQERLETFLEGLRSADFRRALICSHGRTIRALLCLLTDTPLRRMDDFPHSNTALYTGHLAPEGFRLRLFNNTDHLIEIPTDGTL